MPRWAGLAWWGHDNGRLSFKSPESGLPQLCAVFLQCFVCVLQ